MLATSGEITPPYSVPAGVSLTVPSSVTPASSACAALLFGRKPDDAARSTETAGRTERTHFRASRFETAMPRLPDASHMERDNSERQVFPFHGGISGLFDHGG